MRTPEPRTRPLQRVLIANDDLDLRGRLAHTVVSRIRGCTVECVGSFEAALESVASNPPDAVLVDLSIPGPRNAALVRDLRAIASGANLLIVAMTGSAGAGRHTQLLAEGVDHCFGGRVDTEEIVEVLVELSSRRAA